MLFSGTAFVVAMFGMLLVPNSIMRSLAAGAILVGIVSVVAALTLLPAVLRTARRPDRLAADSHRRQALGRPGEPGRSFLGCRRPACASPAGPEPRALGSPPGRARAAGPRAQDRDERRHHLPDRFVSKQGFVALERDFPGTTTDPVDVVVSGGASSPDVSAAVERLRSTLATDDRFERERSSGRPTARWPCSRSRSRDPSGDDAVTAVRELRADIVPEIFAGTNAEVLVGGTSSERHRLLRLRGRPDPRRACLRSRADFVLLTIVFRSIVVAGTAVA